MPPSRSDPPQRSLLRRYPLLAGLLGELTRLEAAEDRREADRHRQRRLEGMPEHLDKVSVPWVAGGRGYWLSAAQREVVRVLTEASVLRQPDVHESVLLREAGSPRTGRLADLFAGSPGEPALGELILAGRPGYYRLAPPPPENGPEVTHGEAE